MEKKLKRNRPIRRCRRREIGTMKTYFLQSTKVHARSDCHVIIIYYISVLL